MQTGFTIFSLLSVLLIVLVLLSIVTIFIKRSFRNEGMLLLLVVNGLLLVKYLLSSFTDLLLSPSPAYLSVFNSIELILLLLIFLHVFDHLLVKRVIYYSLAIYISVVLTLGLADQISHYEPGKTIVEAIVLTSLSIICLARLMKEKSIFIFHSPLFWISSGTLCYYSMLLGIEVLSQTGTLENTEGEKDILLFAFNFVRHVFYTIACFQQDRPENELRMFKESSRGYPL